VQPRDINTNLVLPPPLNTLLDDPNGRVYRGSSSVAVPANFFGPNLPAADIPAAATDRIEAVSFPKPGAYLVICNVRTHFLGGMYGFVIVLPEDPWVSDQQKVAFGLIAPAVAFLPLWMPSASSWPGTALGDPKRQECDCRGNQPESHFLLIAHPGDPQGSTITKPYMPPRKCVRTLQMTR